MARRKQFTSFHKFLVVSLSLIAIEIVYLEFFSHHAPPVTAKEAIDKSMESHGDLSDQRREQLKIQIALVDFHAKNKRYPNSLDELVPTYFDLLPTDPTNGKPFRYVLANGKYTLGEPGVKAANAATSDDEKIDPALLASLENDTETVAFVYNPAGKRDPFQAFDFSSAGPAIDPANPLTGYDYGQLRLTTVLQGFDEPIAVVENGVGHGFTVKKGTKIGRNGGEVVEIQPDKLLILEQTTDFTGQKKSQTIELKLHTSSEQGGNLRDHPGAQKPR